MDLAIKVVNVNLPTHIMIRTAEERRLIREKEKANDKVDEKARVKEKAEHVRGSIADGDTLGWGLSPYTQAETRGCGFTPRTRAQALSE